MSLMHPFRALVAGALLVAVAIPGARAAAPVQVTASPGGIEAWVVEAPQIPMVALEIVIPGGASAEPTEQAGVTAFLAALLTEGAGGLDAAAFSARADELALRVAVEAGRDEVSVSARMLTENLEESLELLRLALTEPRLDPEAVERVRAGMIASLRSESASPEAKADLAWRAALFDSDPYGRRADGTEESLAAIGAEDLRAAHARAIHRSGLSIGVVGDISAAEVGPMLDRLLGALPATAPAEPGPAGMAADRGLIVVPHDAPQTLLRLVAEGLPRDDPDFIPAFVMNHILGGGGFSSRLTMEVREKRGLTYGAYSYLTTPDRAPLMVAGLATANATAAEALETVKAEMARMRDGGVTEGELEAAKRYLTGAWPLQFDSNAKIAARLAGFKSQGLTPAYLTERNALVEAVTLEDVARVAARLLDPPRFLVVAVGRPEGLESAPASN